MTIEEKRRELFEAWAEGRGLDLYCSRTDLYEDAQTLWAWSAWRAALDAVVIDIRKDYFPGSDNMGAIVLDKNYSRFAFMRIIEDTGLGLKVLS